MGSGQGSDMRSRGTARICSPEAPLSGLLVSAVLRMNGQIIKTGHCIGLGPQTNAARTREGPVLDLKQLPAVQISLYSATKAPYQAAGGGLVFVRWLFN